MNNSAFVALLGAPERIGSDKMKAFVAGLAGREGLETVVTAPHLLALGVPGAARLVLDHSGGVVWGHLFERATGMRVTSGNTPGLDAESAEAFLERFWGGYVAIRTLSTGIELLRDPSGAVACYHSEIDGVHVFTSRPDLLFTHRLIAPRIDWTIVAQSLAFSDLRPAATALRGVGELLPGVAAHYEDGRLRTRCAWSPWRFASRDVQILDRDRAIAALREAARATLRAWGGCFAKPMLEISGGLDSSIVAAGLGLQAAAPGLTFGPAPGDPDERPYARAVASHIGLTLHELLPDLAAVDVTRSDAAHLPRPCARAFSQALDRPIQALVAGMDVDAFVGGGGGDNVFCHLQSSLPVLDQLLHSGPSIGVLRTAADIARLSRTTIWQVLAVAARRWQRRRSQLPRPKSNRFLGYGVTAGLPWPAGNPWLEAPAGVPPGKKRHAWSLIGIQNHVEGYGREVLAPHFSPLLSQPIMETCLAIPSWLWCEGGNNRAIAREAFRDLLPAAIIDRRTKGGFDTFVVKLIEANRPVIRAMLLEGSLAHEGLLDLAAVDAFLTSKLDENEGVAELLALVDAEAWANDWERRSV